MDQRELVGIERIVGWLPAGQPIATRIAISTGVMALCFGLQLASARYLGLPGLSLLLFGVFACAVLFNHGTGFYAGRARNFCELLHIEDFRISVADAAGRSHLLTCLRGSRSLW